MIYPLVPTIHHLQGCFFGAGRNCTLENRAPAARNAQNAVWLQVEGKLGLILPDGIIAGEKYRSLRKALIEMHCIEKVIELPRRSFRNTDAKTHILVLSKNRDSKEHILVAKVQANGKLSDEILYPTENFTKRLDYSYIKGTKKFQGRRKVSDVVEDIFRGSISSSQRRSLPHSVLHTTDLSSFDLHVTRSRICAAIYLC